jgi:hypothetical protein
MLQATEITLFLTWPSDSKSRLFRNLFHKGLHSNPVEFQIFPGLFWLFYLTMSVHKSTFENLHKRVPHLLHFSCLFKREVDAVHKPCKIWMFTWWTGSFDSLSKLYHLGFRINIDNISCIFCKHNTTSSRWNFCLIQHVSAHMCHLQVLFIVTVHVPYA